MRQHLTPMERGILKRIHEGATLTAMRNYPRDWSWTLAEKDGTDRKEIDEGTVASMARIGAGRVVPTEQKGDYQTQAFVLADNKRLREVLLRKAPPSGGWRPTQLDSARASVDAPHGAAA